MPDRYQQRANFTSETHFTQSPTVGTEYSQMTSVSRHLTTFNAGDIVPIYCREVLPGEELDFSMDSVVRLTTMLRPVFGELYLDIHAFFVPNRIVNRSWVNVQGENSAGAGIGPDVQLAPLVLSASSSVSIPVGSLADYYGYPTQAPISGSVLAQCHDLKFRGYLEIWNEFYRDQNYQPPIPYSKLNVYEGFFQAVGTQIGTVTSSVVNTTPASGAYGPSSIVKEVYGEGMNVGQAPNPNTGVVGDGPSLPNFSFTPLSRSSTFSALLPPLKANKLHDYFTSVLPYPQKGLSLSIMFPSSAQVLPLNTQTAYTPFESGTALRLANDTLLSAHFVPLGLGVDGQVFANTSVASASDVNNHIYGSNLFVNLPAGSLGTLDISDLRTVIATQQVFETLARCGSRYREMVQAFFGIEADDPYKDIPEFLGSMRRTLNNYQVAQTSESSEGGTAQANLAAYSYTATGGSLFHKTFLEHGYVHVFAIVRQKNLYSTLLWPDNFRRGMLDFYLPQLANISEQPIKTAVINPFLSNAMNDVFGYQEAWAEYRYEPDMVSGKFRAGLQDSLTSWLYADAFDSTLDVADAAFIRSNAQAVIDPTLAVSSSLQPQFFAEFAFKVDKKLPMPVYSIPGLDVF